MKTFDEIITDQVRTVSVVGHVRPDGDCLGAVLSVRQYLKDNYPGIEADAFAEEVPQYLRFLEKDIPIFREDNHKTYDLCISVDCSDKERIGAAPEVFERALKTACIDHHETNPGYADVNCIEGKLSSACELLYRLFDKSRISRETAVCLYTGMVHDTDCFRYESTSPETLRAAADLIEKGFDFAKIIRESLVMRSWKEAAVIAEVTEKAVFLPEEQFLYAFAPLELQEKYGATAQDLGSVVSSLNEIAGAEVVLFCYQLDRNTWKGSLRSKEKVNVADFAKDLGGGGHMRAAGFDFTGEPMDIVGKIRERIRKELSL